MYRKSGYHWNCRVQIQSGVFKIYLLWKIFTRESGLGVTASTMKNCFWSLLSNRFIFLLGIIDRCSKSTHRTTDNNGLITFNSIKKGRMGDKSVEMVKSHYAPTSMSTLRHLNEEAFSQLTTELEGNAWYIGATVEPNWACTDEKHMES